ncbi:hypothetical protein HanXRQr2_Chr14g0637891 [Helianthus annuus]|nr:hypothetical protein HanXRQr2_Chr14g0637891 [Helianthus annuus]KAJ0839861.1 hypothetical protein HanPSC8_Chr14g0611821 [Helianthus annuus]
MGALQYILNLLVIYLGNLRSGFKRKSKVWFSILLEKAVPITLAVIPCFFKFCFGFSKLVKKLVRWVVSI